MQEKCEMVAKNSSVIVRMEKYAPATLHLFLVYVFDVTRFTIHWRNTFSLTYQTDCITIYILLY